MEYQIEHQEEHHILASSLKQFLTFISIIIVFGIVMVYSASYIYGKEIVGSSHYFAIKQIGFVILGSAISFIIYKTKISFWYKYSILLNIFFTVLTSLTLTPLFGVTIKGAHRWLKIGDIRLLQPAEFLKMSVLISALYFFEEFEKLDSNQRTKYTLTLIAPLAILLMQPDFGTFFICLLGIGFAGFISSFPRKYFFSMLVSLFIFGLTMLFMAPYRVKRLFSYLDPWKDPQNSGFQIIQSYLAFANGHITGQGIGNSNEKLFYLPEAHNDFILSVIGEEVGLIGITILVLMFLSVICLGFKMSLNSNNRQSSLIVASATFILGIQVFLNMGVVLGLLPTKGLNLPFVSYGGSSMLANFVTIGIIASAVRWDLETDKFTTRYSNNQIPWS